MHRPSDLLRRGSGVLRRRSALSLRGSAVSLRASALVRRGWELRPRRRDLGTGRRQGLLPGSVRLLRGSGLRRRAGAPAERPGTSLPLYPRLLRLRHLRPGAWQRAALAEGVFGVAVLLVLADVATAWTLLALPLAVAGIVKAHDVLAGMLRPPGGRGPDQG